MKSSIAAVCLLLATQLTWAQDPTSACLARLAHEPALQGLAQRTPLTSLKTLSLKMLADTSMPAAADLPLLAQWNEQLKQCYSAGETYREHTVTPESKAILDAQ